MSGDQRLDLELAIRRGHRFYKTAAVNPSAALPAGQQATLFARWLDQVAAAKAIGPGVLFGEGIGKAALGWWLGDARLRPEACGGSSGGLVRLGWRQ
jgi:hypothetical protein